MYTLAKIEISLQLSVQYSFFLIMASLIKIAFNQLFADGWRVVGENIGTDSPIWNGVDVVYEDCLEEGSHSMTLDEVLLDPDACGLIFDHITRSYFEGIMM